MDGEMIHICYCCNDRYFPQVLLSALSLVRHTQEPVTVHIATMTLTEKDPRWTPFTEEQRVIVENVLKEKNPESRAEVIDMTEEYKRRLRGGVNENTSFSPYSMIRLLLDLYDLPDKLIYVDTDAMFCDSANELWKQDVEGHEVGAVYEVWYKMLRPFYFWKPFYCNSGVLLLNVARCRETGLLARARARAAIEGRRSRSCARRKRNFRAVSTNSAKSERIPSSNISSGSSNGTDPCLCSAS